MEKLIAYVGFDEKGYTSHLASLYLMDRAAVTSKYGPTILQLATGLHWAGDNSGVYFTVSEAGSDNLYFRAGQRHARETACGNFGRPVSPEHRFPITVRWRPSGLASRPGSLVTFA